MVSPPFFFPLIFYALIYLSFVLATTITDHDDNWQLKKKHHQHTNQLPTYSMCQTGDCNNSSSSSGSRRDTSSWAAGMFILLLLH